MEVLLLHSSGWIYNKVTDKTITGSYTYIGLGKNSLWVFLGFLFSRDFVVLISAVSKYPLDN